jgi:hypothetical protein
MHGLRVQPTPLLVAHIPPIHALHTASQGKPNCSLLLSLFRHTRRITLICRRSRCCGANRALPALRQPWLIRKLPSIARLRSRRNSRIAAASTCKAPRTPPACNQLAVDKFTRPAGPDCSGSAVVALVWHTGDAPAEFGKDAAVSSAHAGAAVFAVCAAGLAGEARGVAATAVSVQAAAAQQLRMILGK